MNLTLVIGTRPNFVKMAAIVDELNRLIAVGEQWVYRLVHTGQHYDAAMSGDFMREIGLPDPDAFLGCGGGTQAEQTAAIMVAFERELLEYPSDMVVVVGDVTSTMACAITAKKLHIKVAHVEAGLRSFDRSMPEELNRILTDSISDLLFTSTRRASQQLMKEGIPARKIHFVGNVMIDTLKKFEPEFHPPQVWKELNLQPKGYLVLTLHRPRNVDQEQSLMEQLERIASEGTSPVIFPIHPRTKKNLDSNYLLPECIHLVEPLSYKSFNYLVKHAKGVITDSGGISEETSVMKVPCITLRPNTERPETVEWGTNELAGNEAQLVALLHTMEKGAWKAGQEIEGWDGRSAQELFNYMKRFG